jgi:hypothetical protein
VCAIQSEMVVLKNQEMEAMICLLQKKRTLERKFRLSCSGFENFFFFFGVLCRDSGTRNWLVLRLYDMILILECLGQLVIPNDD